MTDVAIIGAGVIGASVAWHLASRGCRDVVVVDRATEPGMGSTGRATGGFRAQFGTAINVRLSLLSRTKLRRFKQEVGADAGFREVGYLFVARRSADLDALALAQRVQRGEGLEEARMVSAEEVAAIQPGIARAIGGAFCGTDGVIAPMQILRGYIDAAKKLGVRFEFGARTAPAAKWTVNAAGAWASSVSDVPVKPLRRCAVPAMGMGRLSADGPMTIFVEDGFHFRVRDGRALLLWPDATVSTELTVEPAWLDRVEAMTRERVPALEGVALDRAAAWAGLYEMSPDGHAILGFSGSTLLVNGSSGHGVMHAPALGQLAAEMILDGKASMDVTALRPSRFAEGAAIQGPALL